VVFGAAGKTGRAVCAALAARGVPAGDVRRLVRPGRAGPGEYGVDLTDPAGVAAAMDGAEVTYVLAPNLHPDEPGIVKAAVEAAVAGGASRLVYHSVLRPGIRAMPHHWHKLEAEELLWTDCPTATVLQPSAYAQNLAAAVEAGRLVVPYAVDVPFALVDLAEVAEVAARVLTEPGHAGASYELAGPVTTIAELADRLGLRAERSVPPRPAGSEYSVRALHAMFDWYDLHGLSGNPGVLEWLLGRPPRPAAAVLRRP
jgi:uncharacterized protein YbjT (DUF2867 family)